MNVMLPTRRMTVEEFFAWSEDHPDLRRCELIDGVVVVQQAENWGHTHVKALVFLALHRAIEKSKAPFYAAPSGPAVRVGPDTAFEPDVIVAALPKPDRKSYEIANPVIVVEVLSPSTKRTDRGRKREGYFSLPTVQHYLIVDPDAGAVLHLARRGDEIVESAITSGTLTLDPPGLAIELGDVFP